MSKLIPYVGVDKDSHGGMTAAGKIILDAWIFGIIPETETCNGWDLKRIEAMQHQVNDEWDKYGCMVSGLPDDIRARHKRIYDAAIARAKQSGWEGEYELRADN